MTVTTTEAGKARKHIETSMSLEAFDLINCFYDGVDILVRELAEQYAIEMDSIDEDGVILIEREHVDKAGCAVVSHLRTLLNNKKLPEKMTVKFKGMTTCFDPK